MNEWVELRSTLLSIDNKEFSCSDCLSKYSHRSDSAKMTELSRTNKGCFSVGDRVLHSIGREILFKKCVGNFVRPEVFQWLEMHSKYEHGVMPYPGSMMDQPNKAVEIFRIIGKYRIDKAIEENERAKAKAKRGR